MGRTARTVRRVVQQITCFALSMALLLSGAAPAVAAVAIALPPSADPAPLSTTHTPPSAELAGSDRVATAARIAQEGWSSSEYVVIATSANFPDALAGAPLAHALGAPLLLTPPNALAPAVASEITRLGATRAVVLGGSGALAESVITGLVSAGIARANIERISGADRYETARDIAARLRLAAGPAAGVVLASGLAYPDALAAAGYAARTNSPILLTRPTALDAATREALAVAGDVATLVVGGTGAVSDAVATEIGEHDRIFGADRYETAAAIAEYAFEAGVMNYGEILVATGETFPDALAAGPYAARTRATLVLTRTAVLPTATEAFIKANASATQRIVFLGGVGAVSASVRSEILDAASGGGTGSETVVFADANLEAAIRDELRISTGPITRADMLQLGYLDADDRGVSNLAGIEYASNLVTLWLNFNQISDLTPLAGLTNLEGLHLYGNQITDVAPLAGLTSLTRLALEDNQISDITPLAGMTNLRWLDLDNNQISDLTPLSGLTGPMDVWLYSNQISDITPLAGMTNLTGLDLGSNPIADLAPLASLTGLTYLGLNSNQIRDLTPISRLTNLTGLGLQGNQITDLSRLASLTNLEYLWLDMNQITSLTPLSGLTRLTDLGLWDNQISDLAPLAGLTNLTYLDLSSNQIGNLTPLAGLTNLAGLSLDNNRISDLSPLVANRGLASGDYVHIWGNPLDLTPGAVATQAIAALQARGVSVEY